MINTIIFDLSEVILYGMKGVGNRLDKYFDISGDELYKAFIDLELYRLFDGFISEDEFFESIKKKNSWDIDTEILKKEFRNNFLLLDGTLDIIKSLKQNGYKLGILSVHVKEWVEYCQNKYDYEQYFDEIVYSYEIASSKPAKRGYLEIIDKLNCDPKNTVFVDDKKINILMAERSGIEGILFKNSKQLRLDLIKYGVNIG